MKKVLHAQKFLGVILMIYFCCSNVLSVWANSGSQGNILPYSGNTIVQIMDKYKNISDDADICVAIDLLTGTKGDYSRQVVLGNNETHKPIKILFKNLTKIHASYGNVDALGLKRGSQIYIYINEKHKNAPVIAIAALIAHEALHQDEYNSLSEETYAWTTEAIVWGELVELYPQYADSLNSLACREKVLNLLYEKGGETSKYIKSIVYSSPNYENLPETSPGFSTF